MSKYHLYRIRIIGLGLLAAAGWFALWTIWDQPPLKENIPVLASPMVTPDTVSVTPLRMGRTSAQSLSQHVVAYNIQVSLDATQRTLHGSQTLTWRNPGQQPVQEMYFHLYPNAFTSAKSTFNRESKGKLRSDERTEHSVGSMHIHSMTTADGLDLTSRITFVQPDDGNKHDRTLALVQLDHAVAPNATVTLHVAFEVKLPEVYARMGYKHRFVMAGQWFPKVAVYEPAGRRGRAHEGWNAHQYHGNSEFYADFGSYHVSIEVPEDYIVAATGSPVRPPVAQAANRTKTYHYAAEDVHDFAWAASPDFVYVEEPFAAHNVPGLKIKLYLDPRHRAMKDRYLYAAKKSLEKFSAWYGPYPYNTLSIVVPPPGAGGAGGMEYPTLITAWAADTDQAGSELESVVVHEIGHQYWYGMVASNEFEEAWLDEGFTSYAEDKVMASVFGQQASTVIEASYITNPAPLTHLAWAYNNHDHYAENVYIRGKLILLSIEREIGSDVMQRVLNTYFMRWRFNHPTSTDFQQVLEEVTGRSWASFFAQFIHGDRMVDHAVEHIQAERTGEQGEGYAYKVLLRARGGTRGPVQVQATYTDGSQMNLQWTGNTSSGIVHLPPRMASLRSIELDPQQDIILEHRRYNNFMLTEIDHKIATRWNMSLTKIIELLISHLAW